MDITKETAKLVGDAINASGKTVADVANAIVIPRQTLARRITGEEKPFTTTEVYAIARALGISASSLLPSAFFQDAA